MAQDRAIVHERQAFSDRLARALHGAGHGAIRPTAMARLFNAASPLTVTSHAVRKWMRAGALPSQKHVQTLAGWLACDAAWLRYGNPPALSAPASSRWSHDAALLADVALLSADARALVDAFMQILLTNLAKRR